MTRSMTEVHTSLSSARAVNSATHIMPMLKKLVRFLKDVFKISLLDALSFLLVFFCLYLLQFFVNFSSPSYGTSTYWQISFINKSVGKY